MKILYIHNSLPEYRYGYFLELNKICDLTIVFTDIVLGRQIYGTAVDDNRLDNFNTVILNHNYRKDKKIVKNLIENNYYDLIIIPALDDIYHISMSYCILACATKKNIKTGLFWEKWRANPQKQSIKRRIKEFIQVCLIRWILEKTDIFWAPGKMTKKYLEENGVNKQKINYIHDSSVCSDSESVNIREKYGISDELSIILYFGRLVEYKGADVLIRAFARTNKEFQKKHFLLIAGSGPMEKEYKRVAYSEKIENYCFTGFVDPKYRSNFFKTSDIFVLPVKITKGKVEAWGLTVNEAIQFGNIVIATDAVGSAYELINEKNGFIIKENNVNELANAMMNAFEKKKTANFENMKLSKVYSYSTMARDIIQVL